MLESPSELITVPLPEARGYYPNPSWIEFHTLTSELESLGKRSLNGQPLDKDNGVLMQLYG